MKTAAEIKAAIMAANDRPLEAVDIPEWGVSAFMAVLTARDRGTYEADLLKVDGKGRQRVNLDNMPNVRERLVARCLVDETGVRVFSDGDIAELGSKNSAVVLRLFEIAQRINGMSKTDIEALEKNSESNPDDDSSSI
jgi:hypothetical protein